MPSLLDPLTGIMYPTLVVDQHPIPMGLGGWVGGVLILVVALCFSNQNKLFLCRPFNWLVLHVSNFSIHGSGVQCRPELSEQCRCDADAWTRQLGRIDASALMRTCVRRTHQAGKDFSFVMHYNSFASCGIVMIKKRNSQV